MNVSTILVIKDEYIYIYIKLFSQLVTYLLYKLVSFRALVGNRLIIIVSYRK